MMDNAHMSHIFIICMHMMLKLFLYALLQVVAVVGTIRTRQLKHTTSEDALTAHYLGGRSFGPLVLFGTMFASLFSGGTIVGMPQEAYYTGKYARYIASLSLLCSHTLTSILSLSRMANYAYH